ncbi:MAG: 16S rRNA (guanine(527)-N(7))-methyltransferase RsmG [Pseudomonadota bacterium]
MNDFGRAAFRNVADVSRETEELLEAYSHLLAKWTSKINLVAPNTLQALWTRHFLDSMQLWNMAPKAGRWVDLGSGGGFPGLVIAILGRQMPTPPVTLVESDQRKAAFLRTVIRELKLPAAVIADRIEDIEPLRADVLTARALAPLGKLLEYTARHRETGGVSLFPKGERADDEIGAALDRWRFECQKLKSETDEKSTILKIGTVTRV